MTWTDERIEVLTRLWNDGLSASQIGRELGVSKNAVVGKAHRLKLKSRPSPIRHRPEGEVKRPRRLRKPQLPGAGPFAAPPTKAQPATSQQPLAPTMPSAPSLERRPQRAQAVKRCMWPIGDPSTDDFHFCGAPAEPGKPYCEQHCERAYVVKRSETEAA